MPTPTVNELRAELAAAERCRDQLASALNGVLRQLVRSSHSGSNTRPAASRLQETLRVSIREAVRASDRKQKFIAEQLCLSEQHLSRLLNGQATISVVWAERILAACGWTLTFNITPRADDRA